MIKNVFVVMPAYNAGATIEQVFARIPEQALQRIKRYVGVDDGSTDNIKEAASRIARSFPDFVLLKHDRNRGYGAAEKTLLQYALEEGAEAAILLHSDGQYSPECIPEFLDTFDNDDADLVQGSRLLGGGALRGGMPLYKFFANKCLTTIENWAFEMNWPPSKTARSAPGVTRS